MEKRKDGVQCIRHGEHHKVKYFIRYISTGDKTEEILGRKMAWYVAYIKPNTKMRKIIKDPMKNGDTPCPNGCWTFSDNMVCPEDNMKWHLLWGWDYWHLHNQPQFSVLCDANTDKIEEECKQIIDDLIVFMAEKEGIKP